MKTGKIPGIIALFVLITSFAFAQEKNDPVLFTYGDNQVSRSEFQYFFDKSNFGKTGITEQDLRDNLELYINFKLKVKEAEEMQMDTIPSVGIDLTNYIDQLFQSYVDKEVMNSLVDEAYERLQADIRVSHILINIAPKAKPKDTVEAYLLAMDIRERILNGEDFGAVAQAESGDKYAEENRGDLGYLTAMQVPFYNFENNMYNLAPGQLSMPIRTSLGYHIIKTTDKRPAMGTMQVAHVLVSVRDDAPEAQKQEKKTKIDEAYNYLMDGTPFEEIAKVYSDDKTSAARGGLLDPFGTGRMVQEFEAAALALENDGDISKPVRSKYGWHILKRVSRTDLPPLEEMRADLKNSIMKNERYQTSRKRLLNKYKVHYSFVEFQDRVSELKGKLDSTILVGKWQPALEDNGKKTLFIIGESSISQSDLITYIRANYKSYAESELENVFAYHYQKFKEKTILEYGLNDRYPEFLRLKQEYREGIIMFALMEQKVWNKAVLDTAGLEAFYSSTKNEHTTPDERIDWTKFICVAKPKVVKYARKVAKKDMPNHSYLDRFEADKDKIFKKYYKPTDAEKEKANEQGEIVQTFIRIQTDTYYKKGKIAVLDDAEWVEGAMSADEVKTDTLKPQNNTISFYKITRVIPPGPLELNEARGIFVDGFQKMLEKQWINDLRQKYPVAIQEEVLKTMLN